MSVSYAVDFASLLLLGPHETMIVAAASAFSQCHLNSKERNAAYRTLFSMASLIVTVQGAGLAFTLLGGRVGARWTPPQLARPLVGAATAYFVLNTGFVATAIALSSRDRILAVWQANFLWSAPSYFVGAGAAALAVAVIEHTGYWLAPLTFAPLYLTYRTYKVYLGRIEDEQRHVEQTSELHLATIEALARAIDAKDQTAHMHIRRVQLYATALARSVDLGEAEIQGIKTAALLHDIGKLAVPEHILSKPGPLTQEEFQKIRIHPQVGAEIIAAVPFPYPVAPLILSHHERWDGKGYPQGLKGEDIPLGARILTIVDYFDAVTTERPYHKALTHEGAMGLLKHESGRALDPRARRRSSWSSCRRCSRRPKRSRGRPRRPRPIDDVGRRRARGRAGARGGPAERVREHRARAPRDLRALRDRADDGHEPGRRRHDGAHRVEADQHRAVVGLRAVPAPADTEQLKCRFAAGVDAPQAAEPDAQARARAVRLGGAQPPHARQRQPARHLRRRGRPRADRPEVRDRLPAVLQRPLHRHAGALPRGAGPLHRGPPPAARAHRRAGRAGHPQLDRLRADPGRLAHRSADGAAEPPLDVRAPVARAGARRAPAERGRAHRDGHRRVQDDQRHPRPPGRRPRAARGGAARSRPACAPTTCASATPATSSSSCSPTARARPPRRSAASCSSASATSASKCARAGPSTSPRAPACRSSRTTARRTKRCSPTPISACTATRRRAAAHAGPTPVAREFLPPAVFDAGARCRRAGTAAADADARLTRRRPSRPRPAHAKIDPAAPTNAARGSPRGDPDVREARSRRTPAALHRPPAAARHERGEREVPRATARRALVRPTATGCRSSRSASTR